MLQLSLLLLTAVAPAQRMGEAILHPKAYSSPDGSHRLDVDPTDRLGRGPGKHRLSRGSAEVWSKELPFTLWNAVVADSGHCAGYAYTAGEDDPRAEGDFVVTVLSPQGETLLVERTKRSESRFLHSSSNPIALGMHLQPELDLLVVRIDDEDVNQASEEWCVYRLSTGERLSRVRPKESFEEPEALNWCLDARAVPGTPLTLAQWYRFDSGGAGEESRIGARFLLLDGNLRLVWSLELPDDYSFPQDLQARGLLLDEIKKHGCILPTGAPRRFEIRHVRAGSRVTYEVMEDASTPAGWRVREVERAVYEPPRPRATPSAADVRLRQIATAALTVPRAPRGPIRDVLAFHVGDEERIRFVRREQRDRGFSLVSIDPEGLVESELAVEVPDPGSAGNLEWFPLDERRWLAVHSPWEVDQEARAWRVDADTGEVNALEGWRCPSVERVVPLRGGGFAALATYRTSYTHTDALIAFEDDGSRRWEVLETYGEDSRLFSPSDLAVLPDGRLAVVESVGERLRLFRPDGELASQVDLKAAWNVEDLYPSYVIAAPDGTMLVYDSEVWRRIRPSGEVIETFELRRFDGSTEVGRFDRLYCSPSGALWTTDGRVFLRFGRDGVVDRSLGPQADASELNEPGQAFLDGRGRIAIEDQRTHALHVFDASGARLFVCRPDATDFDGNFSAESVLGLSDGNLLIHLGGDRYLRFSATGQRLERLALGGSHAAPIDGGRGGYWVIPTRWRRTAVQRVGSDGSMGVRLERLEDRRWFEDVIAIGAASDGALAVLEAAGSPLTKRARYLVLYSPSGSAIQTVELAEAPSLRYARGIALGRNWVVLSSYHPEAYLVSMGSTRVSRFECSASNAESSWAFGLSPDESELWAVESDPPTLHRYALPR
jgi:hypothetical protein